MKIKLLLGMLAAASIFMVSCEVSNDSHETTFKFTQEGKSIDASNGAKYYKSIDGTYILKATVNDTVEVYINVPNLKAGVWTQADNGKVASVYIMDKGNKSVLYTDGITDSTDYYISIEEFDNGGGWVTGKFEARIGSLATLLGIDDYITITNGVFDLTTD